MAEDIGLKSRVKYSKLTGFNDDDKSGKHDRRFDIPPAEVPVASICLALFLTLFGIASFILAWMHFTQQILGKEQAEIGLSVLGLLTFVPGYYQLRIAYYAWRGYRGYTYDAIPSY